MSIVNAWICADRAIIGADTLAGGPGVRSKVASKMVPIVHFNAVLACRGSYPFFSLLTQACLFAAERFDDLVDELAGLATRIADQVSEAHVTAGVSEGPYSDAEITLVGWSPRRGAMLGVSCKKSDGYIVHLMDPGCCSIAPWEPDFPEPPVKYDPADVQRYVQYQARILRERYPDVPVGGTYIIAEVKRDGMKITPLCEIP